jgi:hypothetical protein
VLEPAPVNVQLIQGTRMPEGPRRFSPPWTVIERTQLSLKRFRASFAEGRRLLERLLWLSPEPVPNFLIEVPVPCGLSLRSGRRS